ncbi:hypothetical protein PRZ48_001672 [Zasmidium cellare]|uniref:Uncharacterized protein n=1 Tax=Zasmidium cellare TaxID=395010 RepID=A0ABR0F2K9_ZASCE|nr:hypothetical protein PRZ48_001672 [Zasmidium cellare]
MSIHKSINTALPAVAADEAVTASDTKYDMPLMRWEQGLRDLQYAMPRHRPTASYLRSPTDGSLRLAVTHAGTGYIYTY